MLVHFVMLNIMGSVLVSPTLMLTALTTNICKGHKNHSGSHKGFTFHGPEALPDYQ